MSVNPPNLWMKSCCLALLCVFGITIELQSQIRDDEPSMSYLATQCAVSGGGDASNYEEYGRRLAKVVGFLSPEQQERVFGFVPQPISFARPDDVGGSNSGSNFAGGIPDDTSNSSGDSFGTSGAGTAGNSSGGTGSDGSESAIGNTNTQEDLTEPETNGAENEPESDWWGSFFSWLEGLLDSIVNSLAEQQQL